jgi:hypothetical protein
MAWKSREVSTIIHKKNDKCFFLLIEGTSYLPIPHNFEPFLPIFGTISRISLRYISTFLSENQN